MNISIKPEKLKYLVLGAGGLGLALRALLYATALDEQGLLTRSHPLSAAVWALSIAVVAGIFLLTRGIEGPEEISDAFRASTWAGIGCLLAAAGILLSTLTQFASPVDTVETLARLLGFGAAAALAAMAFCRLTGAKPFFLLYAVVCLYFALRMVCRYRYWSSDPQLQDYCFHLLACVCLMLSAYHHGAFGAELGSHKALWRYSLMAVYLCCLSLAGPESQLFSLGCGIWAFTNLSDLSPKNRRQRPSLNLEEAPGTEEV